MNELVLFESSDGTVTLQVQTDRETVWLNRTQLAELFGRDVKTIGKHIANALREELDNSVVVKFATTAADGKNYQVEYYNLDMVISVGYRVKLAAYAGALGEVKYAAALPLSAISGGIKNAQLKKQSHC